MPHKYEWEKLQALIKSHNYNPVCNTLVCIFASSRIVRGYKENTEAKQGHLALPRKHVAFQAFAGGVRDVICDRHVSVSPSWQDHLSLKVLAFLSQWRHVCCKDDWRQLMKVYSAGRVLEPMTTRHGVALPSSLAPWADMQTVVDIDYPIATIDFLQRSSGSSSCGFSSGPVSSVAPSQMSRRDCLKPFIRRVVHRQPRLQIEHNQYRRNGIIVQDDVALACLKWNVSLACLDWYWIALKRREKDK
jgi:hypothetical protein